ncbi:MAG: glutathione S-transferase [Gammaproteobacteria bacterium]|nr:glutathione S-transferase [Gammaproteobacteria bacterium]
MKLYDMHLAPNPRRVRMFLAEKNLDIPKVEVSVVEGENLKPDFKNINYRGLLPTLELDDGTCLDESVAICRYIEELQPEPNLLGRGALEKARIESWQRHMEFDGFWPLADFFRNTFPAFAERAVPGLAEKFPAIPELAERGRRRYEIFLEGFNDRLKDNEFVAGDRFTIADITAFVAADWGRRMKLPIPERHSHSSRWYAAVSRRPSAGA